jgi:hypothetical protein
MYMDRHANIRASCTPTPGRPVRVSDWSPPPKCASTATRWPRTPTTVTPVTFRERTWLRQNERGLSLDLALSEAQRVQLTITWCVASQLRSGAGVVCGFDFLTLGSDELGLGPFTGSTFRFTVREGEIVEAAGYPNFKQFASQMRAPFAEWVAATYPRDFEVMYGRSIPTRPSGFRQVSGRPTEESIRLWDQHTREYVEEVRQGTT